VAQAEPASAEPAHTTNEERTSVALRHIQAAEGVRLGGEALGWRRIDRTDEKGGS
jgi:hypothetical protein